MMPLKSHKTVFIWLALVKLSVLVSQIFDYWRYDRRINSFMGFLHVVWVVFFIYIDIFYKRKVALPVYGICHLCFAICFYLRLWSSCVIKMVSVRRMRSQLYITSHRSCSQALFCLYLRLTLVSASFQFGPQQTKQRPWAITLMLFCLYRSSFMLPKSTTAPGGEGGTNC